MSRSTILPISTLTTQNEAPSLGAANPRTPQVAYAAEPAGHAVQRAGLKARAAQPVKAFGTPMRELHGQGQRKSRSCEAPPCGTCHQT